MHYQQPRGSLPGVGIDPEHGASIIIELVNKLRLLLQYLIVLSYEVRPNLKSPKSNTIITSKTASKVLKTDVQICRNLSINYCVNIETEGTPELRWRRRETWRPSREDHGAREERIQTPKICKFPLARFETINRAKSNRQNPQIAINISPKDARILYSLCS